jgi:hypothetical protein
LFLACCAGGPVPCARRCPGPALMGRRCLLDPRVGCQVPCWCAGWLACRPVGWLAFALFSCLCIPAAGRWAVCTALCLCVWRGWPCHLWTAHNAVAGMLPSAGPLGWGCAGLLCGCAWPGGAPLPPSCLAHYACGGVRCFPMTRGSVVHCGGWWCLRACGPTGGLGVTLPRHYAV